MKEGVSSASEEEAGASLHERRMLAIAVFE